ncbi:hypothetical protein IMCC3135_14680 [Granulosicoccus antarcticus IMCC3135]|uniref:Kazal-like domain-containing protein n=1 Tax=Granulosicoccus antarcticus IMCC3135 TaxID=1192854 RepID=A0A2Z2NSM5_9GAMM|nr:hypothetical protein IMCC3135_14680 [Granulosicoccus antarcticus IMCC3135]
MSRRLVSVKKSLRFMLFCGLPFWVPQMVFAHSSIINNKAWEVCEKQVRSDSCEYTDNHEDIYRGTCQLMSEKLLCVRNQPIVKGNPDAADH